MGKLALILLFLNLNSLALVPENFFQDDLTIIESIALKKKVTYFDIGPIYKGDQFHYYANDPDNRISDEFPVPKYFYNNIHFWFNIYTLYNSNYSVLHDKKNLKLIYDIIDYTSLAESGLNHHTKFALQSKLTLNKVKVLKKAFNNLGKGKNQGLQEQNIIKALKHASIKIPRGKSKIKAFYKQLSNNLRAQTGQKDNIQKGLFNILPYEKSMDRYFEQFKLPKELKALPFLESSFNTKAKSKVGATGTWQFMKHIGKHFMPVNTYIDGRLNPLLSTISALHLLKQNKQILKSWDLAITAYNSGPKHYIRAKRKLKKSDADLEYILRNYKHPHIGFASINFYSEFTALVYALAYRDYFYKTPKGNPHTRMKIFLTKCTTSPATYFKNIDSLEPDSRELNLHFKRRKLKTKLRKGQILFSDVNLNPKKYYELPTKYITKKYPKNWKNLVSKMRCNK
ncbi:lytic transglycosylase domain-containing protein [Halobacteriovorax sp. HLS]|uniref:lytic transglycosylase domain-containing protein n=1 Tax=Halobacteriovorax sp. HLS TaxID=2234000 RepID=UPI000FDA1F82|nr:lytic transglycosylase domain-containing protein [Halobacteriovorax sp. HLS]